MDHERSIAAQSERHAMQTYEDSKRESAKGAELATLRAEIAKLRERAEGLAEEVRKSRAILGPFGTLRDGVIHEDGLMYEDSRRATDAAGWLEGKP